MTNQSRGVLGWILLLAAALTASGCGYTNKDLFPKQFHTVAVPMFENRTFYRGVESDLSEALTKQIESRTPYTVGSPSTADTMLEGTITKVSQQQINRNPVGGMPEEMEVTITVDFQWKDLRTGKTIVDRKGFQAVGRYVPAAPVNQPFAIAQHEAVAQLARDITNQLQTDW